MAKVTESIALEKQLAWAEHRVRELERAFAKQARDKEDLTAQLAAAEQSCIAMKAEQEELRRAAAKHLAAAECSGQNAAAWREDRDRAAVEVRNSIPCSSSPC